MEKINFNQITKSYNGRVGCACGCNGSYTIPSHVSIEDANASVGYNAYGESDVSDRRVKIALTKINNAIDHYGPLAKLVNDHYEYVSNDVWFCYADTFVAIDIGNRATTIYFEN